MQSLDLKKDVKNKYEEKVLRLISYYCEKTIGNEVLFYPDNYSYYFRFKDSNVDIDWVVMTLRRLVYKFQYFIYSLQIEGENLFSLKIKHKEFERFPTLFTYKFEIDSKYIYVKKAKDENRKYLNINIVTMDFYRKKEKPLFETIVRKYGCYLQDIDYNLD